MKLNWHLVTSFRFADTGSIQDVHLLMRSAYTFWANDGAWRSILESVVDVLKCGVLACCIFILAFMMDWDVVLTCASEKQCLEAELMHAPSFSTVPGAHSLLMAIVFLSAVFACLYEVKCCIETYYLQNEMHDMLCNEINCGPRSPVQLFSDVWFRFRAQSTGHEELRLGEEVPLLSDLSWSEFLHIFCSVIQQGRSVKMYQRQQFDELRAVQALMVYDNYFVALHQTLLHPASTASSVPAITRLDPSILRFLIQSLFDESNSLDVTCDQNKAIREKLLYYLVAYWAFYPFLVSHALIKIVVKNVATFRVKPTEFIERAWTPKSRWTFRLYNEVPHVTHERLTDAQALANEMIGRTSKPSPMLKFVERLSSTVMVVVLFLSFINPQVLMGGMLVGRPIVWWLSASFIVYTASRGSDLALREYNHTEDVKRLAHFLHYDRPEWHISCSRFSASMEWDYFQSRWYLVGVAFLTTLMMPLILLKLYLDDSIPLLIDFIQTHSSRVDGLGSIAADADFLKVNNDTPRPRAHRGEEDVEERRFKQERSIASFASVYPRWRQEACDPKHPQHFADFLNELFEGVDKQEQQGDNVQRPNTLPIVQQTSSPVEQGATANGQRRENTLLRSMADAVHSSRSLTHERQHRVVSHVDDKYRGSLLFSSALHENVVDRTTLSGSSAVRSAPTTNAASLPPLARYGAMTTDIPMVVVPPLRLGVHSQFRSDSSVDNQDDDDGDGRE